MKLNDYEFPQDEMTVSCDLPINDKGVSNSSSSTESSLNGFDPKIVNCSLLVNFEDSEIIKEISALAESVDEDGAQTVYTILNNTANVMGVDKVYFSSKVSLREMSNHKQAWMISFTLKEKRSIAERKDERLNEQTAVGPAPATGTSTTITTESPETKPELTSVEQVLQYLEDQLKPDGETSNA